VLVRKGVPAKSLADLRGRRIGVTSPGSSTHQSLNYLMARVGLKPEDYIPVSVGNAAGSIAAIKGGKIDATIVVEPLATVLLSDGDVTPLMDMRTEEGSIAGFGGPYPEGSLYATDAFIAANPKTVQAMTNAVVRADRWLQTATGEQVAAALPQEFVGSDPALFAKSFEHIRSCLSPDGLFAADGVQRVHDLLATSDPSLRDAKIDLGATYTNAFVEKALDRAPPPRVSP
jgi:NitT/TauT family transport system substrate-binding protein